MTPYRRILLKRKHLPAIKVKELMAQAEQLVRLSCSDETAALAMWDRLKFEVDIQHYEAVHIKSVKHVAELLWTSCQVDPDGRSFSNFLNGATRYRLSALSQDIYKAHVAAKISLCLNMPSESDNSLRCQSNQPQESFDAVNDAASPGGLWYQNIRKQNRSPRYPIGGKSYRGSSMPEHCKQFFDQAKGKLISIPNYFSTLDDRTSADSYLSNVASQGDSPVLWEVRFDDRGDPNGVNDTDFLCNDVRFVEHRAPDAPNEKEFLFVPYAVFRVVDVKWQPYPTTNKPHVICLEVCDAGEEMLEGIEVSPWS